MGLFYLWRKLILREWSRIRIIMRAFFIFPFRKASHLPHVLFFDMQSTVDAFLRGSEERQQPHNQVQKSPALPGFLT
ncbi:hypothetical protein ASD74_15935 [Rhizobium sp. Root564]|nr:hypothetical protein ASD74_15935 [Rhizobium sp. Root564]